MRHGLAATRIGPRMAVFSRRRSGSVLGCRAKMVPVSDLRVEELTPAGGSWSGLLFENPARGYPLTLTWAFSIDFCEVVRDYGSVSPNLVVEWVPVGASSWRSMRGARFSVGRFGVPIEASLYFFEHHRYDEAEVVVHNQDADGLDVAVSVRGDIDGLGIGEVSARANLSFGGIYVQTEATGTDPEAAAELLRRVTEIGGLRPRARGHNVVFEPVA